MSAGRHLRAALGLTFLGLVTAACSSSDQLGLTQPFQVAAPAQFIHGALPGEADAGSAMAMTDAGPDAPPQIRLVNALSLTVVQGQAGKKFSGTATANTFTVATSLDDGGSGYWVVPVGPPSATGDLTWDLNTGYGGSLAPGKHNLRIVALDEKNVAGAQYTLPICVASSIPDNTHACDPNKDPPRAIISLTWDTNVDLDLQVLAPKGILIDSKHPANPPTDATMLDGVGALDHDSNAMCQIDNLRSESVVWNTVSPKGRYGIYVNLFDACKQPVVHFKVDVYSAITTKSGAIQLKRFFSQGGELLDISANGGSKLGMFVSEFVFN